MRNKKPFSLKFTYPYCYWLLCRFIPYYLYHYAVRPYRQPLLGIDYQEMPTTGRQRRRSALYDAMFNLLFVSYTTMTGRPLHPSTGQMLMFLRSAMTCFDDCFEERIQANASVSYEEMMAHPSVQTQIRRFEQFVQLSEQAQAINDYLQQCFVDYYYAYVQATQKALRQETFENVLALAHLDSGVGVRLLMEVAALFNGNSLSDKERQQFFLFGMISKFVDDMIDIRRDIEQDSFNLLYTVLENNATEKLTFYPALYAYRRLDARWWHAHCPQIFSQYFDYIEQYYEQITSPMLRFTSDLVLLPAIIGYDFDASRWDK